MHDSLRDLVSNTSGRVGKVTNKKKKREDLEKNKQKRKKSKAKRKTVQAFDPHADIDLSDEGVQPSSAVVRKLSAWVDCK